MTFRLLTTSAFGFVVGAAALTSGQPANETAQRTGRSDASARPRTLTETKQRLLEGNRRFVAGQPLYPHMTMQWRNRLAKHQKPFATILGCSDSRVPIELLFDQGFGDLFVVRVAGNVVDTDVTGSVEYGVDHLNTKLVVVMGHENCGAVTAALYARQDKEPGEINSLLRRIQPALRPLPKLGTRELRIAAGVEANVRQSVAQLRRVPDLKLAVERGDVEIVGCIYSLQTGKIQFLDNPPGAARPDSANDPRSADSGGTREAGQ